MVPPITTLWHLLVCHLSSLNQTYIHFTITAFQNHFSFFFLSFVFLDCFFSSSSTVVIKQAMHQQQLCNLKIHVNGQSTFILNQKIISTYSGKLKRMINQEQEEKKKKKKKTQIRNPSIEINEFPGGSYGFELVSRFCYNNGRIPITPSNISLLHCSAIFLEMTEDFSPCNLLHQTETFLEGMFYWSWSDILISLKNCEGFFTSAESSGLLSKLISSLLTKISQNSDLCLNPIPSPSPSSSSSSPETPVTGFRLFSSSSTKTTPESFSITATPSSPSKSWWFDALTILPPKIIEKVIQTMGYYGTDNNNLVVTKFLLHYLKTAFQTKSGGNGYSGLAETAVYGVVLMGKTAFSCRGLFWVQRVVSGFGMKRECRDGLERLIGEILEKATLDDLLVCGGTNHNTSSGEAYDVDLVLRLIRVFVNGSDGGGVTVQRMKKVGRLVDKYMGEISPDHNLKVSKFVAVAESLPACARDCFDGVYRAIDIYLESHPTLSFEKRSKLCKCLNYEKLTLEACKDLAKNPRIPPNVAVQALISQKSKVPPKKVTKVVAPETPIPSDTSLTNLYTSTDTEINSECSEDKEELKLNLQRMQCRVMELEKVCSEMKSQMSKMVKDKVMGTPVHNRTLYKLC